MNYRALCAAIFVLIAGICAAHAFGHQGKDFGRMGKIPKAKISAPIQSCNGTGLNFTVACNSQYIGTL
jgi:hypothetical protein